MFEIKLSYNEVRKVVISGEFVPGMTTFFERIGNTVVLLNDLLI